MENELIGKRGAIFTFCILDTKDKEKNKMKAKIARNVKRGMCTVLATLLLISLPVMDVRAAEIQGAEGKAVVELEFVEKEVVENNNPPMARTALYNCLINVDCSSDGMLVEFYTNSSGVASVIGVTDIKIQKKVWYGWSTVATSSGGERENSISYGGNILYEDAEYGATYRVSCVHYADVDGYEEQDNQTENFVFTY